MNVDRVYDVVKTVCGRYDKIYEDYLIYLVGYEGLYILKGTGLIELIDGRTGRKSYKLLQRI